MWNLSVKRAAVSAVVFILTCALAQDWEHCSGKFESPFNASQLNVVKKEHPDIEYPNIDTRPKGVHMTNNGHTVQVTMSFEPGKEPRIKGGPLERNASYQFEEFYFLWADKSNSTQPAELHVIMRCLDYPDIESARRKDHGILVMAYFFRVRPEVNPHYNEFLQLLSVISQRDESADLVNPQPLMNFLSTNLINFYSYIGSLTTSPCAGKVVWIEYYEPIGITKLQLSHFSALIVNPLRHNFRTPNNQIIYDNVPKTPDFATNNWGSIPFVNAANAAEMAKKCWNEDLLLVFSVLVLLKNRF